MADKNTEYRDYAPHCPVSAMEGQTPLSVVNHGDEVIFTMADGTVYIFYHAQDCCESVRVEDVIGDLEDLIGVPLLSAFEETSEVHPEDSTKEQQDSFTWTFYRFQSIKGAVTIRWYGESNGCYSELVRLVKETPAARAS